MGGTHFNTVPRHIDSDIDTQKWLSQQPVGDVNPDFVTYYNDFAVEQDFAAADWVITTTEAGGGDATEALAADEDSGALLITNDAADNDLDSLQHTQEIFRLTAGKRLWFKTRLKINDNTQTDLFVGLAITDTTPLDTTDRIGFQTDDGDDNIDALSEKDSTETNTDTAIDFVDDTYIELGFYFDGAGTVQYFVNDALSATHTTNLPDDENMCITIHLQNGEAVAKTATIDYIFVRQER